VAITIGDLGEFLEIMAAMKASHFSEEDTSNVEVK
jgi:hypothetical protein